jgi:hypothetical protein
MSTREHRVIANLRSVGRFRRVNFGRNDSRLILKNPTVRRMIREAERRIEAGLGIRISVDELRKRYGVAP